MQEKIEAVSGLKIGSKVQILKNSEEETLPFLVETAKPCLSELVENLVVFQLRKASREFFWRDKIRSTTRLSLKKAAKNGSLLLGGKSAEEAFQHPYRLFDILVVHIQMSHGADPFTHRADQDSLFFEPGLKFGSRDISGFKKDEIGIHLLHFEARQAAEAAGQPLSAKMILAQSLNMMFECVTTPGRHHARLT